ncbi:MAG: response regulator [Bdellovibrionota bacterium]|nr:response regulator [Bdellovibrionota bacterium]|tara:strand:+ start:964 stop:1347 length:384 start_codon:yes stop_codon:yes gene_type:complete
MPKKEDITVLLADDEPDILELVEEEFSFEGYKTLTATCGNDGAELVKENQIDVVISDYKMPNGDGMTILQEVNKIEEGKRPLFFFVSGQSDVSPEQCLASGAKKFYTKPFDIEELVGEIARHLGVEE